MICIDRFVMLRDVWCCCCGVVSFRVVLLLCHVVI